MTRQHINIGTTANDGTGDTLRAAGDKINDNFVDLYKILGGDSDYPMSGISFDSTGIIFEGTTVDAYQTYLRASNPTAGDVLITMPDSGGIMIVDSAEQDLYNKHLYTTKIDGELRLHGVSGTGYYFVNYLGQVDSGTDLNVNFPALADSATLVFDNHTQTLTNKTLTSPVIDNAIVHGSVQDSAGLELITFTSTGSAVNELRVTNSASGSGPIITVSGDDANIDMQLTTKGTGTVLFNDPQRLGSETLTSSTAISVTVPLTMINSGAGTSMTMGDGNGIGQVKTILNIGAGSSTVTPTNLGNGSTFTLHQYASVDAIWQGANWYLMGLDSAAGLGNRVIVA